MEDLLFLAHRIPYPPNKGDKIRSYHILRHLARSYRIHLGAFVDDPHDLDLEKDLSSLCSSIHLQRLQPVKARLRSLGAIARGIPLSVVYYNDRSMQRWVNSQLASGNIKRIFVFSSPVAQYVMNSRASACRRVIDFVDVDSDKWSQYARHKSWPMSWLYRREAAYLLAFEKNVASTFDASIFVSSPEAGLFRRLAPEASGRVTFLDNGVNREYFSPARDYGNPYGSNSRVIVFTGMMDYWANVHAVQWFAHHVLPRIRQAVPSARFFIVGARPTGEVQRLASLPGVEVTGAVADVRPYLAHAHAAVAPLRIARGVQNKVLEAMAMEKVIIATSAAVEGIEFNNPEELLVADGEQEAAEHAISLLRHERPVTARRSREWVSKRYDWNENLVRIEELLESPRPMDVISKNIGYQLINREERTA